MPDPLVVVDVTYLSSSNADLSSILEADVSGGAVCPSELPLRILVECLSSWGQEARQAVLRSIRKNRMGYFIARESDGYYLVTSSGYGLRGTSPEALVEGLLSSPRLYTGVRVEGQETIIGNLTRSFLEDIRQDLAHGADGKVMTGVPEEDAASWGPFPTCLLSIDGGAALLYIAREYDAALIGDLVSMGHTVVRLVYRSPVYPVNMLRKLLNMFPQDKSPIRFIGRRREGSASYLVLLDWDELPEHLR